MATVTEYIVTYIVTLKNAGLTSVLRADIIHYLHSVGFNQKKCFRGIDDAIRNKDIIPLSNGKLSLNLTKK